VCRTGLSYGLYKITKADKEAREEHLSAAKEHLFNPVAKPSPVTKAESVAAGSVKPELGLATVVVKAQFTQTTGARVKDEPGATSGSEWFGPADNGGGGDCHGAASVGLQC
jgi:hypothetical protein